MQEAITTSQASSPTTEEVDSDEPAIRIRDLDFLYGSNQVIHKVSLDIFPKEVMAFIGPSGCGGFNIAPQWIDLLSSLLLLVYGGYFGARSAEKIVKNWKK